MKPFDFFCLSSLRISPFFIGLLVFYAGVAISEPRPEDVFTPSNELILNLSDKWLDPQANLDSAYQNTSETLTNNGLATGKKAPRKANIGCNMDVSSLPIYDDSMTSRLEGKCNFDYRY